MTARPSPPARPIKPSAPASGLVELVRFLARAAAAEALSLARTPIEDEALPAQSSSEEKHDDVP